MAKQIFDITPQCTIINGRKRVAAYARVSCDKDAMLHSMRAQIDYYRKYITRNPEWEFAGVYADEAKTGTKEDREQFQQLLTDCRMGRVDMVIVKSISRLARNTVTLLATVRELKGLGINVFFEEQGINSLSEEGELMLTLLASQAQAESLSCSENCKWRIRKRFEQGKAATCTMLGYRLVKDEITVVPEEAVVVKKIFDLYLAGHGSHTIANILNESSIKIEKIPVWYAKTILDILRNEKYVGDLILQKTLIADHISKRKIVNDGQLPKYVVIDDHEPIVSREAFDAVQNEIALRGKKYAPKHRERGIFCGKIQCSICGKNYRRKEKAHNIIWCCATYDRSGKKRCDSKAIPEATLLRTTAEILNVPAFDERLFNETIEYISAERDNVLRFVFVGGKETVYHWKDRSRSESWTAEMREAARQKMRRGTVETNGK